jgi:glycosyltransferase involved in cell wall biosynthesis
MTTITPIVHILLPTYNGARFLRQQLDSLSAQDYPNLAIHIRDDGSTDATPEILKEYEGRNHRVDVDLSHHVGLFSSLHILLTTEAASNDLFALCDQDDVWHQNKISVAVASLMQQTSPESTLYVSRQQFVDEELRPLALPKARKHVGFANAVVESALSGCTMVFGNTIRQLILLSRPSDWNMHDWWIYLISSSFGRIVYDPTPRMLYRRHTANTSGWRPRLTERMKERIAEFIERHRTGNVGLRSLRQAERFLDTYRHLLADDQVRLVTELVDMRKERTTIRRIRYAIKPRVHREDWIDDLALRLMIVLKQH